MKKVASTLAVFTASAALVLATGMPAQASGIGPQSDDFLATYAYSQLNPGVQPTGSNNWSCKPSEQNPRPVVLVHGTFENQYADWSNLAPVLQRTGYCVFSLDYGKNRDSVAAIPPGVNGTGDIAASAKELGGFVDKVLAATGAGKVDIVGHSQGGMMPRQYLKAEGGAAKVQNLVGIAPSSHGTTGFGTSKLIGQLSRFGVTQAIAGKAAEQQTAGSDFLNQLNAGGDTLPGVNYTVIVTKYDQVVTPYESGFLEAGPGATVNNITLQNGCEVDASDHLNIVNSPRAIYFVQKALNPQFRNGILDIAPCTVRAPSI
ncbi:MAG: alpha/beta fold hydrolase [Renibacterium salmoninarum]|nr:alpha/beta fold hydrolase [Renibacterium salmoninarum]